MIIIIKKTYWRFLKHLEGLKHLVRLFELRVHNRIARKQLTNADGPVVSLTSYGRRVSTVYLAIESIGSGLTLPSRIILWIDDVDIFSNLPRTLKRLQNRGLEILKCEDFGPHKKYFCYVESEDVFSLPVVTADDDLIYPERWLADLVSAYVKDPKIINCHQGRTLEIHGEAIGSYDEWQLCSTAVPSFLNFALGGAGVIYPPEYLKQLKSAGRGFLQCCPKADDIWLHVNAIRNGWKIRQIANKALELKGIPGTQVEALKYLNQYSGQNDVQISKTYSRADIARLESN